MPDNDISDLNGELSVSANTEHIAISTESKLTVGVGGDDGYAVPGGVPFERVLLRALSDIPAFADQVLPVLHEDFFDDSAAVTIYTFIADDYRRHHVVPDFNVLRVRNECERGHNE